MALDETPVGTRQKEHGGWPQNECKLETGALDEEALATEVERANRNADKPVQTV